MFQVNNLEITTKWLKVFKRAYKVDSFILEQNGTYLPYAIIRSQIFGSRIASLSYVTYGGFVNSQKENNAELIKKCIREAERRGINLIEIHGLEPVQVTSDKLQVTGDKGFGMHDSVLGAQYLEHKIATAPAGSRNGSPLSSRAERSNPGTSWYIHESEDKVTFWLKSQKSVEEAWKALDPKVRNQIRKAEKSGLVFRVCGQEKLEDFYQVHTRNMRDLGSPPHSWKFFREVINTFNEEAKIFCVHLNQKIVASSLAIAHGKELLEVPWAGNDKQFARMCPNMLLYWSMIRYAVQNKFKSFDFGRCSKNSGTYHFKQQWGAEEKPIYWYVLNKNVVDLKSNLKEDFSLVQKIWSILPLWLANLLGPCLRKQITL